MVGGMDGWMEGWMDGGMDGWMDGWRDGWLVGWLDGWMRHAHLQPGPELCGHLSGIDWLTDRHDRLTGMIG